MNDRSATVLFALIFVLFTAPAFADATASDRPDTDDLGVVAAPAEPQATGPRVTVPTCGEASTVLVAAGVDIVIEEEPKGYCHCNVDADCKSKCGDRGGACLITIPCEDPERYVGWCYCGDGRAN